MRLAYHLNPVLRHHKKKNAVLSGRIKHYIGPFLNQTMAASSFMALRKQVDTVLVLSILFIMGTVACPHVLFSACMGCKLLHALERRTQVACHDNS
jgi:hypothetical protein